MSLAQQAATKAEKPNFTTKVTKLEFSVVAEKLFSGRSKRSQMQGARRLASAGVLFSVRRAKPIERNAADGPFSAACL
jgi:hypothetical protein